METIICFWIYYYKKFIIFNAKVFICLSNPIPFTKRQPNVEQKGERWKKKKENEIKILY